LDNDGRGRESRTEGALKVSYWRRYEAENYFVTPDILRRHAMSGFEEMELFASFRPQIEEVMDHLVKQFVFQDEEADFRTWKDSPADPARVIWEAKTERLKLSQFAEDFYRRLAEKTGGQMLLRKGELHRLVHLMDAASIPAEVRSKLDELHDLFQLASTMEEVG
jgi:hypothetical protein